MKDEMTSRERVLTALAHRSTDRIPFSWGFGINMPAKKALAGYMGYQRMEDLDAYLSSLCDTRFVGPDYIGPPERNRTALSGASVDIWGVERKPVSYGQGSYNEISAHPLASVRDIKELAGYTWPSADWMDASGLREKIRNVNRDHPRAICAWSGVLFESAWYMRGFERMFMDLAINPELAWEIMTRVTDYFIAYSRKVLDAADGMIDIVFTGDDIGSQQGLLMSPDM